MNIRNQGWKYGAAALGILLGIWVCATLLKTREPVQATGSLTVAKLQIPSRGATLETEVALTPVERERGLMFRPMLGPDQGMIFIFHHEKRASFWMKNTKIPLSIAFINRDGVILEIYQMKAFDLNVTSSKSDKVAYAIETNEGWFDAHKVNPGDKITGIPIRRSLGY